MNAETHHYLNTTSRCKLSLNMGLNLTLYLAWKRKSFCMEYMIHIVLNIVEFEWNQTQEYWNLWNSLISHWMSFHLSLGYIFFWRGVKSIWCYWLENLTNYCILLNDSDVTNIAIVRKTLHHVYSRLWNIVLGSCSVGSLKSECVNNIHSYPAVKILRTISPCPCIAKGMYLYTNNNCISIGSVFYFIYRKPTT